MSELWLVRRRRRWRTSEASIFWFPNLTGCMLERDGERKREFRLERNPKLQPNVSERKNCWRRREKKKKREIREGNDLRIYKLTFQETREREREERRDIRCCHVLLCFSFKYWFSFFRGSAVFSTSRQKLQNNWILFFSIIEAHFFLKRWNNIQNC